MLVRNTRTVFRYMTNPTSNPLPQIPAPDGYRFRDVQLELSLKPFYDNSPETREAVCREVFEQWRALWRHADSVSIMLLIAEGSEILEFDGHPETEFEWARYHGAPNRHRWELPKKAVSDDPDHNAIGVNTGKYDPEGLGIHSRAYLYREDPAVFTYGWLRDLVADLKRIGAKATGGKPILVGNFFDIGPEFAKSRFKFDWHREILGDGPVFKEQFISCEAVLKGDERRYAAYPEGIPEGTRIGTFLGKQLSALYELAGFDFLWLSNGFGFSLEPWAMVGEVFDGAAYHPERSAGIQERILRFWKDLRTEFPNHYRLRCRGTNLATGIDLGSDASPLREIYAGDFAVDAPVNSPWAALDGDFGLELSGWMSHIARHPGDTFRYRFYTHDPWWLNSPWLDRYAHEPHDIYLPLSVSRLQSDGSTEIPRDIAFLSIDDSNGQMPLAVPNEVIAHILSAREQAPDAPGPLLWAYPFDHFHDLTVKESRPDLPLHADAYMGTVINEGVPLNTVVDRKDLTAAWAALPASARGTVILTTPPAPGSVEERELREILESGANVLLFGPLPNGSVFLTLLGLTKGEPLEGDFTMQFEGEDQRTLRHTALLSGGAFDETPAPGFEEKATTLAEVSQGDTRRPVTALAAVGKGRLVWTRASLSTAEYDPSDPAPIRGPLLKPLDPATFVPPGRLVREALKVFDWSINAECTPHESRPPYLTVHRHKGAMVLSGHHRDEHAEQLIRTPLGAPLLPNRNNRIRDGHTEISGRKAWKAEVRAFVACGGDSTMKAFEPPPVMHGCHRRLLVFGARQATLHFLIEPGQPEDRVRVLRDPHFPYFVGDFAEPEFRDTPHGRVLCVEKVEGDLLIEW